MSDIDIRPFEESHLPTVLKWINTQEIRDAIGTVRPVSGAQHQEWYRNLQKDESKLYLSIIDKRMSAHLGMVGLSKIDTIYRNAELWIYLSPETPRRSGIGKMAVKKLLDWSFLTLGLHRVYVHVFDFNETAFRFFKECGFVYEGRLREAAYKRGRFCDKNLLSILKDEYTTKEFTE